MKHTLFIAALVTLPFSLSGCGKEPALPKAETSPDVKVGQGRGTVTAVDAATGKITLDHGAIPALGWPAMTMAFSAKPDLLKGIFVGDKVDFDLSVTGNAGEVTKITRQ
ncbi:MAG: hypothetical protein RL367_1285 [Pseudomonadota bacterium]